MNRNKHRLRLLPLLLAAAMLTGCGRDAAAPQEAQLDLFAMDTYMNLRVYCEDGDAALREASDRISSLEAVLSVTRPESDIGRINSAAGTPVTVSEDTAAILGTALGIGAQSGGALDITLYPLLRAWGFTTDVQQVPDADTIDRLLARVDYTQVQLSGDTVTIPADVMVDLGALAKGYTGDAVMEILRAHGAGSAIISLGGNVQALGAKPDGSLWSVGVVNPFSPAENLCILQIENQAVITSGNYERYFEAEDGTLYWHILDPADGYPADNGLVSVTVVGDSGLACDALSTALFVEGTEGAQAHWRRSGDFEMVCVTEDARILVTEGLAERFTCVCDMPVEVIARE